MSDSTVKEKKCHIFDSPINFKKEVEKVRSASHKRNASQIKRLDNLIRNIRDFN